MHPSVSGTLCWRRCTESRGLHSLRAMSVSPFHLHRDYQCFGCLFGRFLFGFFGGAVLLFVLFGWLTGFPVLCIRDAQVRRHFQDCHHRHDERSNGAKKMIYEILRFFPVLLYLSRKIWHESGMEIRDGCCWI